MRINHRHLLYFWTVVRQGTMGAAARELHVSVPAISTQVRKLEQTMGKQLFEKRGRSLQLTEDGWHVFRYAESMFALERELEATLRGGEAAPLPFRVGVADVVPKVVARRVLMPVLAAREALRLEVHEGAPERLLGNLGVHMLDMVLMDGPSPPGLAVRTAEHLVGDCGVTIFATAALARRYRRGFPDSLDGAPWLLPLPDAPLRRGLQGWFETMGLQPHMVAEIQDSALIKAFGQAGAGLFATPTDAESEVREQYRVERVGRTEAVRARYYAIYADRPVRHPGIAAVIGDPLTA